MLKEKDIAHENGDFWVWRNVKSSCYAVMVTGATCSQSESAYPLDDDGKSLAIARCDYLAKRKAAKNGNDR